MKITEMNFKKYAEKDSGWVNIPQLNLSKTRLPLLHTVSLSLSHPSRLLARALSLSLIPLLELQDHLLTQVKEKRPGLDSLQSEKKQPTVSQPASWVSRPDSERSILHSVLLYV